MSQKMSFQKKIIDSKHDIKNQKYKNPEFEFEDNLDLSNYKDLNKDLYKDTFKDSCGKGISVLTIGDPHFRIDNLEEVNLFISRIVSLIQNEKPNFVVILGDLLHNHERLHTTVLNKAYTFINEMRKYVPVYILVGNHDYINNSQFLSTNHWMNALKEWDKVFIIDKGMIQYTDFGKFIFCPYVYPGKFIEALNIIDKEWKTSRIIFCHQEFQGCKMGSINSIDGDKWDTEYPFIISGHIHDKQRLQHNIFYTGSSMQHAFGESYDKTITLCHFNTKIYFESIDLDLPRKKIIYMDIDQIQKYEPNLIAKDKLRITLTGTFEEFKVFKKSKKYRELLDHNIKIVYRHKVLNDDTNTLISENFYDILYKLVKTENTKVLQIYKDLIK